MEVAILLFDRLTALDAVGPYEVLARLPGATVTFVAREPGPKRTDNGSLALLADRALTDCPAPDILVVPGGFGVEAVRADAATLDWIRAAHQTTRWSTSVCTGSLVLAAAGLLRGLEATTHWSAMDALGALGAVPVARRVVVQGKIVTAAGVSAGIDMALQLAALEAGDAVAQAIQLSIEYSPEPPFDAGSPATAPRPVLEMVRGAIQRRRAVRS